MNCGDSVDFLPAQSINTFTDDLYITIYKGVLKILLVQEEIQKNKILMFNQILRSWWVTLRIFQHPFV